MKKDFSIILPIYKQVNQLRHLFEIYKKHLEKTAYSFTLHFIINGPDDGSYDLAVDLCNSETNFKAYKINEAGWGNAVKYGIEISDAKYICYTNSARTKIEDLIMILDYAVVNENNIVKANRIIRESFFRKLGSVIYNFENRKFFKTPIWDVNGTPKVFPANLLNSIQIWSDGDLIDAELIAKAFKKNHPIIEIPILSTERISGKSTTNLKSAFNMYFGLIKLKNKI